MSNIFEDDSSRTSQNSADNQSDYSKVVPNAAPGQSQSNQMPNLQLTPEQIMALLNQLAFYQQSAQQAVPQAPVQPDNNQTEMANPLDCGKKIVYQSPDFDDPGKEEPKETHNLSDVIEQDFERKKSFYDDDDVFDLSEQTFDLSNVSSNTSNVKTTDFGDEFSVAEIEISEEELPILQKKNVVTSQSSGFLPPAKNNSANDKAVSPKAINPAQEYSIKTQKPVSKAPQIRQNNMPKENGIAADSTATTYSIPSSMQIEDYEEVENKKEKKKLPVSELIRRIVLGIAVVAILIAGANLLREYKLHKDNQKLESNISDLIIPEETTKKKNKKDKDNSEKVETTISEQQQWQEIKSQYPNVVFPPNLQLKYAKLFATNQDFVGYLSADGIGMGLPIVQADDDEEYLNKNFYGKSTKYGCPFVTHINNITTLDMNTVIFGHHMNDGTVFGILDKYKTIDGFKSAPVITFNTINGDYQWKIIAAFITNAYEKDDNGYIFQYYFTSLSSPERFSAFFNELSQRSLYDTGVDVLESDKILTLSTCSHEFEDARFVVVARLVRPGESPQVNTDNAFVNASPRYPQAYYTKKKLNNPYKDASKWYVG